MNFHFIYWSTVMILSLMALGLCMRWLATVGVPVSESLILRGLSCCFPVAIFAASRRMSLFPRSPKTQIYRALIAGLALSFFTLSYSWLSASAISVLASIDVPLLVILGPVVGVTASVRSKLYSAASIAFLVWFVCGLEKQTDIIYGLVSLGLGSLLLCFGYFFIKKSMQDENEAITILVPSLAIIFYGCVESISPGHTLFLWSPCIAIVSFVSGTSMFIAYYATMRLYEVTDIALAEFPTLLAALFIQPVEAVFLHEPMRFTYFVSSAGFVAVTYFILRNQTRAAQAASVEV